MVVVPFGCSTTRSCTPAGPVVIRPCGPDVNSRKLQASSLTTGPGYSRMYLERIIMDTTQLKRIADALEEILRLVKKDLEAADAYRRQQND